MRPGSPDGPRQRRIAAMEGGSPKHQAMPGEDGAAPEEELPYSIELWGDTAVERVLARALSAALAHSIFTAARAEHPDRRLTLRHGGRIIADTAATGR